MRRKKNSPFVAPFGCNRQIWTSFNDCDDLLGFYPKCRALSTPKHTEYRIFRWGREIRLTETILHALHHTQDEWFGYHLSPSSTGGRHAAPLPGELATCVWAGPTFFSHNKLAVNWYICSHYKVVSLWKAFFMNDVIWDIYIYTNLLMVNIIINQSTITLTDKKLMN